MDSAEVGKTRRMEIPVTSFDQWPLRIQRDVRRDVRSLSSRFAKNVFDLHHVFPAIFFSLCITVAKPRRWDNKRNSPPSPIPAALSKGPWKERVHSHSETVGSICTFLKKFRSNLYGKRCRIYSGFSSEDTNRGLKCGGGEETFSFSFFFFFCPRTKRIAAWCNKDPLGTEWGKRKEEKKRRMRGRMLLQGKSWYHLLLLFLRQLLGRSVVGASPLPTSNYRKLPKHTLARRLFARFESSFFQHSLPLCFPNNRSSPNIRSRSKERTYHSRWIFSPLSPFPALLPVRVCMRGKRCVYVCRAFCQLAAAKRGT